MDLTGTVKEFIYKNGADLVGVCKVKDLKPAPIGHSPGDYLHTAKSVVSFGYSLNLGPVTNLPKSRNEYLLEIENTNIFLNSLGQKTARFLESKGFISIAVPANTSIRDANRLTGDVSQRHIAAAAGLGTFGVNNLLITPKYGSRVRFGMVITEADLIPDQPLAENLCTLCESCVEACPSGALSHWKSSYTSEEGWRIDKEKCYHYMFVYPGERGCGMCIARCPLSNGQGARHYFPRPAEGLSFKISK
jgi:epoxyqueuosine reductase QueG